MSATQRLALPFILPGQAQKELFHNEALQTIDAVLAGAVEEPPRDAPPASPASGACYIVGTGATGEWAQHAGSIAAYTPGGWRFIAPVDGMSLYVRSSHTSACFRGGTWELGVVRGSSMVIADKQVVGPRAPAIPDPAGGTQVDSEARAAISAVLLALRSHGLIEP